MGACESVASRCNLTRPDGSDTACGGSRSFAGRLTLSMEDIEHMPRLTQVEIPAVMIGSRAPLLMV